MKIAFVVSFFDFRNDVREVIREVSLSHQVVVLGNKQDESQIKAHLPDHVDFRPILERGHSIWNTIWERVYLLFKRIPKSRHNYFLMELFKASNLKEPRDRRKAYSILKWSQRLPKAISYDFFLKNLHFSGQTEIADIDHFIFCTAISNDYLLSRLIQEGKSVSVYVYSWDHPCKHSCFSKHVNYLSWSEAMKSDLIKLQNIENKKIKVIGASQFSYIDSFRKRESKPGDYPFKFIYFGCAIGISELVSDEVSVIETLAESLSKTQPEWKLLVRPYPQLTNWELYAPLRKLPNVTFDEHFRTNDNAIYESEILKKFSTIEQAEAFFHLGTTMGLEACFTKTPSFIIDFGYKSKKGLSLFNFIHQYQNDQHLIDLAPQNAITSEKALNQALEKLQNPIFTDLNRKIILQYQVKSFTEFSDALINSL